ncbi:unnamed protein product [Withania somnifera]
MIMIIFGVVALAQTNTTRATTDPSEARILNSIFQRWGKSATNQWNISGELCSGAAIDSTSIQDFNPAIKCDCSANNRTLCHITGLRVFASGVSGEIPDELWSLTFLDDLNLAQNLLTGTLSPSIGNLTRMKWLTFGINALSGEIPKELGLLTELESLSFGTNNFSGPLPPELGNLEKLTQIYLDSAGVSGPIPLTFAKLQNLNTVWASDNDFTGRIPDFIGNNWLKLTTLRFEGNAFEGPIPASFSNLTSLNDLRISDLSNGSSSLDFLRNMKSLSKLVLRNNNISGSIPRNIGEYQGLSLLDLSFNNLTGRIPDALFNLTLLTHLFLGDNKLTGALPAPKSPSLQTIDLSYNGLSGNFPSWISGENLQLNLVGNNFTREQIEQSVSSSLPSGLHCLQRNFPCNQGSPIYSNFAIKCGGPPIKSTDQTLYEREDETLGPATYFMTSTGRWAVSNAGLHSNRPNQSFTSFTSSQFTNTLDSELFQTARISAGSLRYYGLGLENANYTVSLQFAESEILNPPTWQSVGRRVFDVYVQGIRELKIFEIKKEAGGRSLVAVQKQFKARVSENHLEIHLFWAGKGTCCDPIQGTYGPSISAISATPASYYKKEQDWFDCRCCCWSWSPKLDFIIFYVLPNSKKKQKKALEDEEFLGIDTRPYTFSYSELRVATGDFCSSNKLGEGGFGPVYKGTLEDERVVAVKQLSVASHQGKSQFVAEIATISAVQHRNLVKLYGCCIEEDRRLLVYEYLENKSLGQALFEKGSLYLDWPTRFQICLGVAKGLAYLHEESRVRIVHRDVKASNILLDADLNPKISDFGLAKLYDDKQTHINTRVAGTIGYLAPEYAMRGHLTEKADVFGFGVVALEIVSGRPNSDESLEEDKIYLLEWAWQLHENKRETELVDANLSEFDVDEVQKVIGIALLCTQTSPGLRPPYTEVTPVTSRPGYLTDWKFKDTTTFTTDHSSQMQNSSTGRSRVATTNYSPSGADTPMLSDIIVEEVKSFALKNSSIEQLVSACIVTICVQVFVESAKRQLFELRDPWRISHNLGQNYITGTLSPSIGNLTRMKGWEISKELGTLGRNNFSGPLPSELGNLTKLTQIYFNSAGVSGPIPLTFAKLKDLEQVRFEGNAFEGPIPASFSNLTSLADLRISDLSNGSSSFAFLRNIKSLSKQDLSFNNLTGHIPDALFNLTLLIRLFQGDNKLTDALPAQKRRSLQTIYLSYNGLSGNFPSWINEQNLQLNPVVNNFTTEQIDQSDSSSLPSGLNCLQRNFPCILQGGGLLVMLVCILIVQIRASQASPHLSLSTNTLDSELLQTALVSAGSLRYYGLGLENGNYTMILQFAESEILNPSNWRALGRRVFDVYVQILTLRKRLGRSLVAVRKQFKARVTENHLEIHLFWAGKWTCCVPMQGTDGPSISAISAIPAEFLGIDARPYTFSYSELRAATGDICSSNKLGEGGFGPVYKGTLEDEGVVAVKQLSVASHQGKSQFICLGVAKGLAYLHEESRVRIVHRDVKASNILRYLSPEYAMLGHLTEKADVFGFRVAVLEIVSGRPNSDESLEEDKIYLLEWAWQLRENKRETELVDANLSEFDVDEVQKVIGIALLCTQTSPGLQPSIPPVASRPAFLTNWKFKDTTTFMTSHSYHTHNSSAGTSTAATSNYSPSFAETPMLSDFIGEGG